MIILPLAFLLLVSLVLFLQADSDLREVVLKAFLITFLICVLSTQLLSLAEMITDQGIGISWLVFNLIGLILLILAWKSKHKSNSRSKGGKTEAGTNDNLRGIRAIGLVTVVFVGGLTLFIALKAPPNNYDSMTYHMARIAHWIQNQSINYYPTSIPRQNYSMPFAEYAILQLQLLSGGDHFANMVQWTSFMLAIMLSTLIAKQIGISNRGQWLIAALISTLPMAILQSTSTQNDLVVGVLCLGFVYFLNKLGEKKSWETVLFAAISMGLALGTKGTAYIYCAAIGLGIGGASLLSQSWEKAKKQLAPLTAIIAIALLLNSGIYFRNWQVYNHPLITSNERTIVDKVTPKIFISNLVRNGAIHLSTPIEPLNSRIDNGIQRLLGNQTQNPASTFPGSQFRLFFAVNEDDSGNTLHFLLLITIFVMLPLIRNDITESQLRYLIAIVLAVVFFSLAFKWQPWIGRLQTPLFFLWTVLAGLVADKVIHRNFFPSFLLILFLVSSIPYLFLNSNRPLLPFWENRSVFYNTEFKRELIATLKEKTDDSPFLSGRVTSIISRLTYGISILTTERQEMYFIGNHDLYYKYQKAVDYVLNEPSQTIGLVMANNDWEYPLWVLLDQEAGQGNRTLYHVDVDNITANIPGANAPDPDLLIITRKDFQDLPLLDNYQIVYKSRFIQISQIKK